MRCVGIHHGQMWAVFWSEDWRLSFSVHRPVKLPFLIKNSCCCLEVRIGLHNSIHNRNVIGGAALWDKKHNPETVKLCIRRGYEITECWFLAKLTKMPCLVLKGGERPTRKMFFGLVEPSVMFQSELSTLRAQQTHLHKEPTQNSCVSVLRWKVHWLHGTYGLL